MGGAGGGGEEETNLISSLSLYQEGKKVLPCCENLSLRFDSKSGKYFVFVVFHSFG